eukprot:Nk52_evm17s226 gene=Nk52_evmTU17s226
MVVETGMGVVQREGEIGVAGVSSGKVPNGGVVWSSSQWGLDREAPKGGNMIYSVGDSVKEVEEGGACVGEGQEGKAEEGLGAREGEKQLGKRHKGGKEEEEERGRERNHQGSTFRIVYNRSEYEETENLESDICVDEVGKRNKKRNQQKVEEEEDEGRDGVDSESKEKIENSSEEDLKESVIRFGSFEGDSAPVKLKTISNENQKTEDWEFLIEEKDVLIDSLQEQVGELQKEVGFLSGRLKEVSEENQRLKENERKKTSGGQFVASSAGGERAGPCIGGREGGGYSAVEGMNQTVEYSRCGGGYDYIQQRHEKELPLLQSPTKGRRVVVAKDAVLLSPRDGGTSGGGRSGMGGREARGVDKSMESMYEELDRSREKNCKLQTALAKLRELRSSGSASSLGHFEIMNGAHRLLKSNPPEATTPVEVYRRREREGTHCQDVVSVIDEVKELKTHLNSQQIFLERQVGDSTGRLFGSHARVKGAISEAMNYTYHPGIRGLGSRGCGHESSDRAAMNITAPVAGVGGECDSGVNTDQDQGPLSGRQSSSSYYHNLSRVSEGNSRSVNSSTNYLAEHENGPHQAMDNVNSSHSGQREIETLNGSQRGFRNVIEMTPSPVAHHENDNELLSLSREELGFEGNSYGGQVTFHNDTFKDSPERDFNGSQSHQSKGQNVVVYSSSPIKPNTQMTDPFWHASPRTAVHSLFKNRNVIPVGESKARIKESSAAGCGPEGGAVAASSSSDEDSFEKMVSQCVKEPLNHAVLNSNLKKDGSVSNQTEYQTLQESREEKEESMGGDTFARRERPTMQVSRVRNMFENMPRPAASFVNSRENLNQPTSKSMVDDAKLPNQRGASGKDMGQFISRNKEKREASEITDSVTDSDQSVHPELPDPSMVLAMLRAFQAKVAIAQDNVQSNSPPKRQNTTFSGTSSGRVAKAYSSNSGPRRIPSHGKKANNKYKTTTHAQNQSEQWINLHSSFDGNRKKTSTSFSVSKRQQRMCDLLVAGEPTHTKRSVR